MTRNRPAAFDDSNAVRGLSHFTFTEPLALELDVGGRLYDYDSITAGGRVALTNFTLRGQSVDNVASEFATPTGSSNFFTRVCGTGRKR